MIDMKFSFRRRRAAQEEATFDLHNHEDTPLLIQAEPDGEIYILPPGGVVQVTYCTLGKGVALTFGMTAAGMRQVTLLDDGAGYVVYHHGAQVL
jgi:hypothetical protein